MDDSQSTTSSIPSLIGCQALEQFLLLAKTARGSAAVELVKQVLDAPGVYVFGELLETDCLKELSEGANASYYKLMEIFAYGTYSDYKREAGSLPRLSPAQVTKLKHLTIVSLASKCQTIPYSTLQKELDIQDLRVLEDLIIEAIYAGIIQAKLDQKNARLEVECFIGKDIKIDVLDDMIDKLQNWCTNCSSVLQAVEEQMSRADQLKADSVKEKEKHELEVKQLRQTLKVAASDGDDHLGLKDYHHGGLFMNKQPLPKKGLRGSAGKSIGKK